MSERNQVKLRAVTAAYVLLVVASGAAVTGGTWLAGRPSTPAALVGFWFFLSLAAECFWLETPTGAGMVSMALAANLATLFVLPPPYVLAIGAISVLLSDLVLHRRGLVRAAFNAMQTALSLAVSLAAIHLLTHGKAPLGSQLFLHAPLAALAAPTAFFFTNTFLVSGVISLDSRRPFWRVWRENFGFGYQILSTAALFLLGVTIVIGSDSIGYLSGLLCLLLFYLIRDAYRRYNREQAMRAEGAAATTTSAAPAANATTLL